LQLPTLHGGHVHKATERNAMSIRSSTAIAASALAVLASALSFAQTQSQVQNQTQPPATETPAPIVIQTTVNLTSGGPLSPQSEADARKEAIAALAEARTSCRRESSRQAQADCLRLAQDDYNAMMGRASQQRPHPQ
jgi:hypothetical protein